MNWRTSMPVYVTRKTADGYTGQASLSAWLVMLILLLVAYNAVGWGIFGLATLVQTVL